MNTEPISQAIERQILLAAFRQTIKKSFEYIKAHLDEEDLSAFEKKPDLIVVRNKYPELAPVVKELFDLWRNMKVFNSIALPPIPPISNN